MENMTIKEEEFYKYLKRYLILTGIEIRNKISIDDLCKERRDLGLSFGKEEELIKDILIDFVLYKDNKAVAGIEIVDEKEELNSTIGERTLIDYLFSRMGYEYFRITDLDKLNEAAKTVRKKTLESLKKAR
ncbi:MAG: hypothetical protein Q4D13_05025 [Erysipelotrichaceae bacterium]|nr:hypothetical protein [Erysipelotrichaceae bacterium]